MKDYRTADLEHNISLMGIRPLDIMVVGATGAGKSTTLNAFFEKEVSVVGKGVDPETMALDSYLLNSYFRLWDTPGLGDGKKHDDSHTRLLVDLMFKTYESGGKEFGFIDLVLVIVDGTSRDMGTTYKIINEICLPHFQQSRLLLAVNQADMAMKGRHWCRKTKKPLPLLEDFLNNKVDSIKNRVKEATGLNIKKPVYYSAEYNYNIDVLFDLIIDNMKPQKRRLKI